MRSIGHLPDEAQARVLGDYLVAQGIRNEIESDTGASWAVWIKDEDQVAAAQAALAKFRVDPKAEEFRSARSAAAKTREAEARAWRIIAAACAHGAASFQNLVDTAWAR